MSCQSAGVAILDQRDRARERSAVARTDAGDELVVSPRAGGPSAPLYGTRTSVSDSRRRSPQVVGSSRMLGHLTAQFAIVRVPEHRGYRNLLLARLISALGTWTAFFAVRIAIYNQTDSAWWVSILLFCELVPSVILGIAVGPLIDRWPRQRMMILSDLGGAAPSRAPVRALSRRDLRALGRRGLLGCVLPAGVLLGDPEPRRARTPSSPRTRSMQGVENIATLIGPFSPASASRCSARAPSTPSTRSASSISALLLLRIGNVVPGRPSPARIGRTHWREVRAGFSLVRNDRYLSSIALIWSWATLAYAGINVAEIALTTDAYGAGNPGFGVFVAFSAGGILIGNVLAFWFIERLTVYGGYRASFLVTAAGVAICAVSPNLAIGCVGAVIFGMGNGLGLVCNMTPIQQVVGTSVGVRSSPCSAASCRRSRCSGRSLPAR